MSDYKESKLDNGLTIITNEDFNSGIVTIEAVVRAGSKYEKKRERGYAHLLEHILSRGGGSRISSNIDLVLDRAGAKFNASTSAEVVCVSAQVISEKTELICKLIIDALINPVINKNVLENEKKVVLEELKKTWDRKEGYLWMNTAKNVFKNHFLSNYPIGEEEDIAKANVKAIRDYHKKFFIPNETLFVCTGNINHKKLRAIIKKETKKWKFFINSKKEASQITEFLPDKNSRKNITIPIQGLSNYVSLSILIGKVSFRELISLDIIVNYLGYRHTSLLYGELRRRLGLVYSVSVFNMSFREACLLYIITSTVSYKRVVSVITDKVLNLNRYLTKNTIEEYKKQSINVIKREINDPFKKNDSLKRGWILYNKLISPEDIIKEIKSISHKDIKNIIKKCFKKERLFTTILKRNG